MLATPSTCSSPCTRSTSRSSPELARLGRGEGYVARQVSGWIDRFGRARTDDTGDWSDIIAWLEAHQPPDVGQCLIHNDFRFDNMVLATDDPMRIIGVLDWEMATVGDPLMDLGGTLTYWVEAGDDEFFQAFRRQPTTAPGMWTRQQIVERYCERMGFTITPEQWRFYEVFGLFRLAVIAQQIWYRYFHKQTTNEAYAVFGPAVGYLEARCRGLVSTGSTGTGSTRGRPARAAGRPARAPPAGPPDGRRPPGPPRPGVLRVRRLRRALRDRLGAEPAARRLAGRAQGGPRRRAAR